MFSFHRPMMIVLVILGITTGGTHGQTLEWHQDVAAAQRASAETGRPLLLDFGTESCYWCKKLDATTFRDPDVVALLSRGFILARVDGLRDASLANRYGVDSYPTLVILNPKGDRVLGRQVGYVEPKGMIALLGGIARTKEPNRQGLVRTTTPGPRRPPSNEDVQPARELLAAASADYRQGLYLCSLERCRLLLKQHPNSLEAADATRLIDAITSDPAKAQQVETELGRYLSRVYLSSAEVALRRDQRTEAIRLLERAATVDPESSEAAEARQRLIIVRGE